MQGRLDREGLTYARRARSRSTSCLRSCYRGSGKDLATSSASEILAVDYLGLDGLIRQPIKVGQVGLGMEAQVLQVLHPVYRQEVIDRQLSYPSK